MGHELNSTLLAGNEHTGHNIGKDDGRGRQDWMVLCGEYSMSKNEEESCKCRNGGDGDESLQ